MPNWAYNHLTITGDKESLDRLQEQVKQPYLHTYFDYEDKVVKEKEVNGDFLLWNCVAPTDLAAYFEYDKLREQEIRSAMPSDLIEKPSPEELANKLAEALQERITEMNNQSDAFHNAIAEIQSDIDTKNDWYNWNVRNWGTKWDTSDEPNSVRRENDNKIIVYLETAWSPPQEAIDHLAKQYPSLVFTIRAIDESYCWAMEGHWADGERTYEDDIEINHATAIEFFGECSACADWSDGDPEHRKEMQCDKFIALGVVNHNE